MAPAGFSSGPTQVCDISRGVSSQILPGEETKTPNQTAKLASVEKFDGTENYWGSRINANPSRALSKILRSQLT
jgi:hypothetical protein